MTLKERFLKIKAAFDGTPPTPPVQPAAPAPAQPAAMAAKTYKLQDGVTEISISQAGDMPAVGDMVTINGAPATEGTLTLADGATLTVDATGKITTYIAAAIPPATPPAPAAPPQPVTLSEMTPEQVTDMYQKFATGTPEERLANAEIMIKALMENSFGWKIREGNENQAIQVYKDTMTPAAPAPSVTVEEMSTVFAKAEKFDAQVAIITRHEETIKQLLELTEQLVELPTADPKTLTGSKKEKFDAQNDKEKRIEKMAAAVQSLKAEAKNQ